MFTVEGGSQKFEITANIDYEVNTNAEWLSYTQNKNSITVTVPNYAEVEERTAEITISNEKYNISKTIKVTQSAFVPEISAAKSELTFEAVGGKQSVTITANVDWEVSSNESWVTCEKTDDGVVITLPIYIGANNRDANITLSNEKYNISTVVKVTQYKLSESERSKLILYTSSDAKIVKPNNANDFGATIVSNTYENGKGVIMFDAPVTSIGDRAFYECTSLTSVTISDSVTSIGEDAFYGCTSLTKITIPDSVTEIRVNAFTFCLSLTRVDISNLSAWCKISFEAGYYYSVGEYANPLGNGAKLYLNGSELTEITIPSDITKIKNYAFDGCHSLKSVTIPNSVTKIRASAFRDCTSLTSVTIGDSVTSIEYQAFYNCMGELTINSKIIEANYSSANYPYGSSSWLYGSKFTKLTIGNSVTSIGSYAFYRCTSLTSITIGNSVTSIGGGAFNNCTSLTSVTIGDSVTSIGGGAFTNCTSLKDTYVNITDLAAYATNNPMGQIDDNKHLLVNGIEIT